MSSPSSAEGAPAPRSLTQRRAAALEHLRTHWHLWLATSGEGHGPHLIPVSYVWNGEQLTTATFDRSRTADNVRARSTVRAAIGSTGDVLMIDAEAAVVAVSDIDPVAADHYAHVGQDPRVVPGFVYIRLDPRRMQVWRGAHEFCGRTVMRAGRWLDEPVD